MVDSPKVADAGEGSSEGPVGSSQRPERADGPERPTRGGRGRGPGSRGAHRGAAPVNGSSGRRSGGRPTTGSGGGKPAGSGGRPTTSGDADRLAIPDDVVAADLDRAARGRLRTLSKDNADGVARHLVMAGRLLEDEPELALDHALEAVRRAGRVDVVREAAGLAAYRTGRYADALRELRAARRLNGSDQHVPLMVDCERGLGRPERALAVAQEHQGTLPPDAEVELAIVVSGARMDLGQPEAALAALGTAAVRAAQGEAAWRVGEARVEILRALGRTPEADELAATLASDPHAPSGEEIVVVDLEDDEETGADHEGGSAAPATGDEARC